MLQRRPVLLALFLAAGGCAPPNDAADGGPDGGSEAPATEVLSNGQSYRVRYTPDPDPIPLNEPFDLALDVSMAADGAALSDAAEIAVDARMPAHGHGMNTSPTVSRGEDGTFAVDGMLFHMPGEWELYVDVTEGDATERATFVVQLEE